jgi:hypothetical protein
MKAQPITTDRGRNGKVIIRIQDTRIEFSSNCELLKAFARSHFDQEEFIPGNSATRSVAQPEAELESHLEWIEGVPPGKPYQEVSVGKLRLDRDIEIGHGQIAWSRIDDFSDLRLRFELAANRLRLSGQHFFYLSRTPLRNRIKKTWHRNTLSVLREGRFSTILYYMIYYPSFWLLQSRGLFPLHAGAVDVAGTGMVFCGFPGCGKSTLSLALLALPGSKLLSDNIIFYDKEKVFSCPEPVLADKRSLELLDGAGSLLHSLGRQHGYGRSWHRVDPHRLAYETTPRLFFFVGLGQKTTIRPLSGEEAWQRFDSSNWVAKEIRRYLVYRSVLGFLRPESLQRDGRPAMRALQNQGKCYELTVGWGDGVQKARDLVHTLAEKI